MKKIINLFHWTNRFFYLGMKKKMLIILILIFITGCSTSFENEYIKDNYEGSKVIRYYEVDESLNSENCFIEREIVIKNDEKELLCQFVKVKGFYEGIYLMIAIDTSTSLVYDINIIEHFETEDYGGYVTEEWFLDRFKGKSTNTPLVTVIKINKKQNEVVAITGATITSDAVVKAVNLCMESYNKTYKY